LPAGINGVDRVLEPVTIGVPLAENSGIKSISALTLSGVGKAQFKAEGFWPNGNIRWIVVDTLTTVRAGASATVNLNDGGSGNFGGPDLATDYEDYILVNTGAARFKIKKKNFNFFDEVIVGDTKLVSSGNTGAFLIRDSANTVFSSSLDSTSDAIIEENGPVKTIIKAYGRFRDKSGNPFMGYTVRFYFYSGKPYAKTVAILKNTFKDSPSAKLFNSSEVTVPLSLGAEKTIKFSRDVDSIERALNDHAYIYQGYSKYKIAPHTMDCSKWQLTTRGTCTSPSGAFAVDPIYSGLEIRADSEAIQSLGDFSKYTPGWMELRDSRQQGMSVVYRWMGAYWPASFDASASGELTVGLYSAHNPDTGLKFPFFAQDYRELYWHFHTSQINNESFNTIAHYPVVGKADWHQYVATKSLLSQTEYLTPGQQANFFSDMGKTFDVAATNPAFKTVYRNYSWGAAGGSNQGDYAFWGALFDWLRTGFGGYYLKAENIINFHINAGTLRTDWDYAAENVDPTDSARDKKPAINVAVANFPATPEMEHHQTLDFPMYYYITGNEEAKDALLDDIEMNIRDNINAVWPCGSTNLSFDANYIRAWSRKFRNMAYEWEVSIQLGKENDSLKRYLKNAIEGLIDAAVDEPTVPTKGRSRTRGFYIGDSQNTQTLHSFFYTQIMFEAIYQAYRIFKLYDPNYVRLADLEECMGGMAQFFFKEYFDGNATGGKHWEYNFPVTKPWISPGKNMVRYPADRAALIGYMYDSGDSEYLKKGYSALAAYQYYDLGKSYPYWTEAQAQALMYARKIAPPTAVWKPITITVKKDSSASYTLQWQVPPGVQQYRIKYSTKPIVNWLNYNKLDMTWGYDPESYTPRYYATLYDGKVIPLQQNSTQSVTIDIPAAIAEFNSNRKRTEGQIGYVSYDPAATYHFDVRYLDRQDTDKPLSPNKLRILP
jgi:hypothetical protein